VRLAKYFIDLVEKPNNHTQIKICCEYKPVGKRGRLKNLFFQRRRCLSVMAQSVDALSGWPRRTPGSNPSWTK